MNAVAILGDAFSLAGRHAAVVFGASLILQAGVVALTFLALNTSMVLGVGAWAVLSFAATQLSSGVYTLLLLHLRHGHEMTSPVFLLKESAPFLLSLFWLGFLAGFGIVVGLLFFVIPGIILTIRWAVAGPALVAQRVGASEALSISGHVTKNAYGTVFALVLIQALLVNGVPRLVVGSDPTMPMENVVLVQALIAVLVLPIVAISTAELFLRLAGVPDRVDLDASGAPIAAAQPTPSGPYVPTAAIPTAPQPAYPQPAQPFAGQPYAAGPQAYTAPAAAQPFAQTPPPPTYPPQPYAQTPPPAYPPQPAPDAPQRSKSVGPPGMA